MAEWTIEQVAARFREAAITVHRLPPVRVQGYFNTWPAIPRMPWETLGAEAPIRRFPPSPQGRRAHARSHALGAVAGRRGAAPRVDARRAPPLARHLRALGL